MKTRLIALTLFGATAATVAGYSYQSATLMALPSRDPAAVNLPPIDPLTQQRPKIEVAFVLDTTGSMSGLIQAAKEKIWSIASTMAQAEGTPEIRMGLVAYRDRGDAYVTRVVDLSDDLDSMYATLMDFEAQGGGDGPESVNQALHEAVHRLSWSQDANAYRAVFLVGDAPPHMDYPDDVKYPDTVAAALQRGIAVNTVQCGTHEATARAWERIAGLGDGDYFRVAQDGGAVAVATPFDEKLAALSAELDGTRLFYGTAGEKAELERKVAAADKLHATSSVASRARRAAFNASESGKTNFLGDQELVDGVTSGRIDLDAIDEELLPEPLQAMAPKERQAVVSDAAERRDALQKEIATLAEQRDAYLRRKIEERGGAEDSLDQKIYRAVRDQAQAAGLRYEAAAPAY